MHEIYWKDFNSSYDDHPSIFLRDLRDETKDELICRVDKPIDYVEFDDDDNISFLIVSKLVKCNTNSQLFVFWLNLLI